MNGNELINDSVLKIVKEKYSFLLNRKHLNEFKTHNNVIWNEYHKLYGYLLNNHDKIKVSDLEIIDDIIEAIEHIDDYELSIRDISFFYHYFDNVLYFKMSYRTNNNKKLSIVLEYNYLMNDYPNIIITDKDDRINYKNLNIGIDMFYNLIFDIQD